MDRHSAELLRIIVIGRSGVRGQKIVLVIMIPTPLQDIGQKRGLTAHLPPN
jgi:hypothetical protein